MKNTEFLWRAEDFDLGETGVDFSCADEKLKAVFDDCERLSKENIKSFGDYDVLIEGAKYNGVWLETQPMGGEMYAKRDMRIALNNILIFLRYQRRDGKLPGMISHRNEWLGVAAHYDWMQGMFLPYPALKMYYLIGKDETYLRMLYQALSEFDAYLWSCRDSNGDGCLESFCIWDVGEDNCTVHMLHGLRQPDHGAWGKSTPPENYKNFPHDSPQYMGYSYACRMTLAKISALLQNGEEDVWEERAKAVQKRAAERLWDKDRHAFFLRDRSGEFVPALTQENIKCMYCGLFTKEMADQFIDEHLLNEEEFWTPYPLPAIAANDPYFHVDSQYSNCADRLKELGTAAHDIDNNSWSGPLNGLIWQRSIEALLNYDRHAETVRLGKKILGLLCEKRTYVQNYHPFTGEPAPGMDGYGPTMLSALEYISILCGVNIRYDTVLWSCAEGMGAFCYTQNLRGRRYTLSSDGKTVQGCIDERCMFTAVPGVRIETDMEGNLAAVYGISAEPADVVLAYGGKTKSCRLAPNEAITEF